VNLQAAKPAEKRRAVGFSPKRRLGPTHVVAKQGSASGTMKVFSLSFLRLLLLLAALSGCSELRARNHARKGNQLFMEGNYPAALQEYTRAEQLLPTLPTILLNKGLACRNMMMPRAKTPASERSVECALAAFEKLKQLEPADPRGDRLYVQTLFDADRFEMLAQRYQQQLDRNPGDLAALNGLIQVYSRWDRWDDLLRLTIRRAELQSRDAEAQYSVGVLIWSRLFQKGGGAERAAYDPRVEPKPPPPPIGEGDIVGDERARLADQGVVYLEKALAIRPKYREAVTYLNLLYRQKSYAFFDRPEEWQACVNAADQWRKRALELEAEHKGTGR
jgi:tetratricopeptide (TPR) repeat protein